jgi:glycosyltransferase involved in cell wall biosynthesis
MTSVIRLGNNVARGLPRGAAAPAPATRQPQQLQRRNILVAVRWPVGGIRTHILYNYPILAESGYLFTFIAPADETFDTFADSLTSLGRADCIGVPVRKKHCGIWREVRRQLRTGRFDMVHSHGVTAAVHTSIANLGLNYPHVATLHDVFRPCHFASVGGSVKRVALSFLLNQAQTLVAVSEDVRQNLFDYLPSLRGRGESVKAILNGVRGLALEPKVPVPAIDLRALVGVGRAVRVFGFLGRFMEQKGFLPLVHALRRLADADPATPFHLVAVGSGDYRNEYAAVVRSLGLGGHVTMLDFIPDVRPIFTHLDLLVIPSLWEASSLLAMEAMAAGVPILGTDCIGLREVLRGTPARMVAAGDVSALAQGLQDALEGPWTEEARAFAPAAQQRFDNAPSARMLADVFDQLLGAKAQ